MSEKYLEEEIIKYFEEQGYKYINSNEINKYRKNNTAEVLLVEKIDNIWRKLNPQSSNAPAISENEIKQMKEKINRLSTQGDIYKINSEALKYLKKGIRTYNHERKKWINRKLIDFDDINKNEFVITNQFIVNSKNPNFKGQQRLDLVIYVNGLPLVVGEIKKLTGQATEIEDAEAQMKNYSTYIPNLFYFNAFSFVSNGNTTKISTCLKRHEQFEYWKNIDNKSCKIKDVVFNLFKKENFLDYVKNFIFYVDEKNRKIIARYYQYDAISKIRNKFDECSKNDENKTGIVWHTTGSGKSLTMAMASRQLLNKYKDLTILIVTDRIDLKEQLHKTFASLKKEYLKQQTTKIKNNNDLIKHLKGIEKKGIFFTTLQMFKEDNIKKLSDRKDILIIADEAHRSHKNYDYSLKEEKEEVQSSFTKILRQAFPNAKFLGFTATPIRDNEKNKTETIFGPFISIYTLSQALSDESVLNIYLEDAKVESKKLKEKELDLIDKYYEEEKENIDNNPNIKIKNEAIKNLRKEIKKMHDFLESPERIEAIAKHFIKHYKKRETQLKGKAMFATLNRKMAFEYYKKILELEPGWKDKIKLIVTSSNKDEPDMAEAIGNDDKKRQWISNFKKSEDSHIKILIVVDMLLTGFDVPDLDVLYFDKVSKKQNLIQAISRVNRKFIDMDKNNQVVIKKEYGLVVDYIGMFKRLSEALKDYWDYEKKDDYPIYKFSVTEIKEVFLKTIINILNTHWPNAIKTLNKNNIQEEGINLISKSILKDGDNKDNDIIEKLEKIIKNDLEGGSYDEFSASVKQINRNFNIAKYEINNVAKQICEILISRWKEWKDESINEAKSVVKSNEWIKQLNRDVNTPRESDQITLKDVCEIEWKNNKNKEDDYHLEIPYRESESIDDKDENMSTSIEKQDSKYNEENWSKEQWEKKRNLPKEEEEDRIILNKIYQCLSIKGINNINMLLQTEKNKSRLKFDIKLILREHKRPETILEQETQRFIDKIKDEV